jgi:EAL and modified HD-GYP domain-containing signal transduction protein
MCFGVSPAHPEPEPRRQAILTEFILRRGAAPAEVDALEKFVARQPIFNRHKQIFGYELLFRSSLDCYFQRTDLDQATYSVVADSFLLIGIARLTGGRRAFFNCTRDILTKGYAELLPPEQTGLELLENIEPDEEVVTACRKLKSMGHVLALDDFIYSEKFARLLDHIDIVKVDLRNTTLQERKDLVRRLAPKQIALLAEKVETHDEFTEAKKLGFNYFQGYFFGRPEIVSGHDVPIFKRNYVRILQLVTQPDPDLRELEEIIRNETSLSYKLLRYLNSPLFGFRGEIKSIRHTLTLLGLSEIRKWISLVTLAGMASDKPEELVVNSLVRANFCESISSRVGMRDRNADLFLMGLFSMMDAILDRPMDEVLSEITLSPDIKTALLLGRNRFRDVFDLVVDYEKGEWAKLSTLAAELDLAEPEIPELYLKSVESAREFFHP